MLAPARVPPASAESLLTWLLFLRLLKFTWHLILAPIVLAGAFLPPRHLLTLLTVFHIPIIVSFIIQASITVIPVFTIHQVH